MKIYDCEQGTPEWHALHMGRPSASEFHRIVQPGGEARFKKDGTPYKSSKGELAEGRWTYAFELAAQRLLGETKDPIDGLKWVDRGKMLENPAIAHYEFVRGRSTAKVGFITPDHGRWGCSPDRLVVGKDGDPLVGLEIKCPGSVKHLEYFINGVTAAYRCQIQGSLMTTGFEFWDFQSYHPQLPEVLLRFERDEEFIDKLEAGLNQFCDEVDFVVAKIKDAGYVPTAASLAAGMDPWEGADAIEGILAAGQWGG
jgi:hypothetical protein